MDNATFGGIVLWLYIIGVSVSVSICIWVSYVISNEDFDYTDDNIEVFKYEYIDDV